LPSPRGPASVKMVRRHMGKIVYGRTHVAPEYPRQVRICAPALSSILAYWTVFSTVEKTRKFAVTGMERFLCNVLTITHSEDNSHAQNNHSLRLCMSSHLSYRNAP
jgi:hypothetical protein